jgi:hypothetical protein
MELEKSAEQVLPGSKGAGRERVGARERGRNDINNVPICGEMNNNNKRTIFQ